MCVAERNEWVVEAGKEGHCFSFSHMLTPVLYPPTRHAPFPPVIHTLSSITYIRLHQVPVALHTGQGPSLFGADDQAQVRLRVGDDLLDAHFL